MTNHILHIGYKWIRFELEQMAQCASLFLLSSERKQLVQFQMYVLSANSGSSEADRSANSTKLEECLNLNF